MRRNIVAGNWKMNTSWTEAQLLLQGLVAFSEEIPKNVKVIIAPPALYLSGLCKRTEANINLAAQNCSSENKGAHTGEISASMLDSLNVKYCIVGHSERRAMYGDTDTHIAHKISQCVATKVSPIFCCGEQLHERENGSYFDVVQNQIEYGLFHLDAHQFAKVVIAYEPVWAIGTGKTATSDQAQEMHAHIRKIIAEKFGEQAAEVVSILYGGSCKPTNAKEIFAQPDVDGGLIGGASLVAEDFMAIIQSF